MIKKLFYTSFISSLCLGAQVDFQQIDTSKKAIQIAVVKDAKRLNTFSTLDTQYDTFVEKRLRYVYYVVNIEESKVEEVLKKVQQHAPDAFVITTSKIGAPLKQLTQPKQNKININKYDQSIYKQALAYYKQKQFQKAYDLFDELFFKDMGNILINYYLGRSAYELKQYEFAVSAYDRILIKEPNNVRVRLELAQTYLQMKLYSQALTEFNTALQGKMPIKVQQKVLSNIELIKQRQTKHFFNITAMFGVSYDSNINSSAVAGDYSIYVPSLNTNLTLTDSAEERSAMIYQTVALLSHNYKPTDNYALESSFTAMALKYNNNKSNDIQYFSLSTKPTYYTKNYKGEVKFNIDKIYYGHNGYQLNYYVTPSFTKVLTPKTLWTTGLKLGQITYDDSPTKDANVIEYQNSLKHLVDDSGVFTFKFNMGKEIEQKDTRTDVSYTYFDFSMGHSYDFMEKYSLQTSFAYELDKYKDKDVNFLTQREDRKKEYAVTLQRKLDDKSVVNLGYTFTDRPSNQAIYDYDKYVIKLNYMMNF